MSNTVTIHPGNISRYFRDPTGPVANDLERRMNQVARIATANASGPVLGVVSGDLLRFFSADVFTDSEGLHAVIGTTAIHDEFGYPGYHDKAATGGKRWLTSALAEGYR